MKDIPKNLYYLSTLVCFVLLYTYASPMPFSNEHETNTPLGDPNPNNDSTMLYNTSGCSREEFNIVDVVFLNTSIFLIGKNITVHSPDYHTKDDKVYVCLNVQEDRRHKLIANCKEIFFYTSLEYTILANMSVLVYNDLLHPGEYKMEDGQMLACALDEDGTNSTSTGVKDGRNSTSTGVTLRVASIYVGKIGSGISIVALIMHLLTFCFFPTLRNLPGCNLAALSIAFLFAYSFVIIGQIPKVLGWSCVASGLLQLNFFLVAFFCMNVLAFDVWKALKLATENLLLGSNYVRKRQFMWYSLYAWGCPLVISTISVLVDNLEGVPEKFKPGFGRGDICFMTNHVAKIIFFTVPSFTLFFINGIFFIRSSMIISRNTMKCTSDQQKQAVKIDYVLYLRLGIMMGLTWLLGVVAIILKNDIVWLIHDICNSLQGLFLFLLFTCTRKVMKLIKEKVNFCPISFATPEKSISTCTSKTDLSK